MLGGKKILLGICGSIAAYKSAVLVRLLVKAGAEVQVLMTDAACEFITPLTLSTLSKKPVLTKFVRNEQGEWSNHVDLGLWADLIVIAPASANTIAKTVNGICDNLLTAVYLSARCPVFFAPAMDLDMYAHPSTQHNIALLREYGNQMIDPGNGELASGLSGEGRMAEPETIFEVLKNTLSPEKPLQGKKALVTAGPTYEAIDPVRFIANHSSGKMGFALAQALAEQGAEVELVTGPTHLNLEHPLVKISHVTSASDMYTVCKHLFKNCDIAIMSAAVADYTPANPQNQKIKKNGQTLSLELRKTTDILAELGKRKKKNQVLVGFALETENELENAREKLTRKKADFIVLNSLNDGGSGFGSDTNRITLIDRDNNTLFFELKPKQEVARDILNKIKTLL